MRFRLVVDREAADGAVNMAVDEALLESATLPQAVPTLRLYHFQNPTVTFGYGQAVTDAVRETACRGLGIEYVRRITGGRALLHQDELTYSVAGPRVAASARETYRVVSDAIRSALQKLGVTLDPPASRDAASAPRHLPCLAVPSGHEITAGGGKKLVAGAMRSRRKAFLLHGSILWSVDTSLWRRLTRLGEDEPLPAVGLRDLSADATFEEEELVDSLTAAFEEAWKGPSIAGDLSADEARRVSELAVKYRSSEWTNDRLPSAIPIG